MLWMVHDGAPIVAMDDPLAKGREWTEPESAPNRRLARVEALLQQALLGLAVAQDRSVKRRIRQRLQRKLSSFLSEKDFEDAMSRFRTMTMSEVRSEPYRSGSEQTAPSSEDQLADVRDVRNASAHHAHNAQGAKYRDVVFDVCYLHFDEKSLPGTPCVCLSTDRQA
eukprot:s464_g11.t1